MPVDSRLDINPELVIDIHQLTEQIRILVIDNFLLQPEMLVTFASYHERNFKSAEGSYPGIVYGVKSMIMMSEIHRFIRMRLSNHLSFLRSSVKFTTQLSMVTLQPEELSCLQRLCHSDAQVGSGRAKITALLYLFDNPSLGGTGFYEWKQREKMQQATALELEGQNKAMPFLQDQFDMFNNKPQYITESNEVAELIHMVPAKFNRLVVFSGDLLRSAYIEEPELLTAEVSTGRLTLNCYASVLARDQANA